jgi:hypothetical protein
MPLHFLPVPVQILVDLFQRCDVSFGLLEVFFETYTQVFRGGGLGHFWQRLG